MEFLNLSGTSSSCLFRRKNFDHTKDSEFLMIQTSNEFRGHNPLWYPETECFMHFTPVSSSKNIIPHNQLHTADPCGKQIY